MTVEEILKCLSRNRVRATYKAVGEVIGRAPRGVGRALRPRRPAASWVVAKRSGKPTGYKPSDMDPHFDESGPIIYTGDELRKLCKVSRSGTRRVGGLTDCDFELDYLIS